MKKNIFRSLLGAALLVTGLAACTEKTEIELPPVYNGEEVYFPDTTPAVIDIEANAPSVDVTIARLNGGAALTVPLEGTVTNEEGVAVPEIFTIPASVTFAEGETEATVAIAMDFDQVVPEEEYSLNLKIANENVTPYGMTEINAVLTYAPWGEMEEHLEDLAIVTLPNPFAGDTYEIEWGVSQSLTSPSKFQYFFPQYYSNLNTNFYISIDYDHCIDVDGVQCPVASLAEVDTEWVNKNYDNTYTWWNTTDWIAECYWRRDGIRITEQQAVNAATNNGGYQSYFNPVTGAFHMSVAVYMNGEFSFSWFGASELLIQLPGYSVPWIEIADLGSYVDATGYETKRIGITSGEIASMKYELIEGQPMGDDLAAAFEALIANPEIEATTENSLDLVYEIAYGQYTMLAVGITSDNREIRVKKYINYTGVQPADPYQTIGYAQFTDGLLRAIFPETVVTVWAEVQENSEVPGQYRLKNPYRAWAAAAEMPEIAIPNGNYYLYLDATDKTFVVLNQSTLGLKIDRQQGALMGYCQAAVMLAEGRTKAAIKLAKMNGTLKNNVISFPLNSLLVAGENEYPEWTETNSPASFKLDLSTLTAEPPVVEDPEENEEEIRGRRLGVNLRTNQSANLNTSNVNVGF